ncbi:MAG: hypothetical protein OXN16_09815 [Gammaproteobacteria bacterium]|nr:hypothetical protein [Gammaproteobacteria bacterium]
MKNNEATASEAKATYPDIPLEQRLLRPAVVAEMLSCSPRSLDRMVEVGTLPEPTMIAPRSPRWRGVDILRVIVGPEPEGEPN